MVRSHLEYADSVWCPYKIEAIRNLEKVQMRATKLVRKIRHLPYIDRLKKLGLPTLKFRRVRGDMIAQVYKIVTGKYDNACSVVLTVDHKSVTRGNRYKLCKGQVKYDLRKYFFTNRIIDIWNSLPDDVVSAETTNTFKNRLDKWWNNQVMYFDWTAEITGTGSRSIHST